MENFPYRFIKPIRLPGPRPQSCPAPRKGRKQKRVNDASTQVIDDQGTEEDYAKANQQAGDDACPDQASDAISPPSQQENAGEIRTGLGASVGGSIPQQPSTLPVRTSLQENIGDSKSWTGPSTDNPLGQTINLGDLAVAQPSDPRINLFDQQMKAGDTLQPNVEGTTNTWTEPQTFDLEKLSLDQSEPNNKTPQAAADLWNIPLSSTAADTSSLGQASDSGVSSFVDAQNPRPFEILPFQQQTAYAADASIPGL